MDFERGFSNTIYLHTKNWQKGRQVAKRFFFSNHTLWNILFPTNNCFSGKPKNRSSENNFPWGTFYFFNSDHRNKFHIHCRLIFFVNLLCFVLRDITFMFFKAVCTLRPFHDFWLTIRLFKRWTVMYSARHVIKNEMRKAAFFYYFDILDSESFEINQLLATL